MDNETTRTTQNNDECASYTPPMSFYLDNLPNYPRFTLKQHLEEALKSVGEDICSVHNIVYFSDDFDSDSNDYFDEKPLDVDMYEYLEEDAGFEGYFSPNHKFYAWTNSYVYSVGEYDGTHWIRITPRNPPAGLGEFGKVKK